MPLVQRAIKELRKISDGKESIALMQFNGLADSLSDAFPRCPPHLLQWENRNQMLLSEITRFSPDIICLEENDHFTDFFEPKMNALRYNGFLKLKENGKDGSVLFYSSRFEVVKKELFNYSDLLAEQHGQVGIMVALTLRDNPQKGVIVCTTHLKAKNFEEMRRSQAQALLKHIKDFQTRHDPNIPSLENWPVIIALDMNSEPEGIVYPVFIKDGFKSAYCVDGKEPEFTTYKFRDTLYLRFRVTKETYDMLYRNYTFQYRCYKQEVEKQVCVCP